MPNQFNNLTTLLQENEQLWKPSAFTQDSFEGLAISTELRNWLFSLTDQQVNTLQLDDSQLLEAISPLFEPAKELKALINLPKSIAFSTASPSRFWHTGIPGRKAEQIEAFVAAMGPVDSPTLEWCCGKQHLGRYLSEIHQQPTLGLDIDANLVAQANTLTRKYKMGEASQALVCDVLSQKASEYIKPTHHLVALHACGGLHARLLQEAVNNQVHKLSLSPCCYHRFNSEALYTGLSRKAQLSSLKLTNNDLRIATRQSNIASIRETQKRKTLQAWRLGFDSMQRALTNSNEYLPTPSLSIQVLSQGFESFCRILADRSGITLHGKIDFETYKKQGQTRFHHYERAELLRMVFRRALELWLVFDKKLFLEENGYQCSISRFCDTKLSPRNLFIQAQRDG
jgi:Methyltransferase domain